MTLPRLFDRSLSRCGIAFALSTACLPAGAGVNVLTQHNDAGRSGANPAEITLTTANVNVNRFGKLFQLPVDGFVFAQPLYVSGLAIGGGTHNVVFVATAHDSVYAFDADHGAQFWKTSLGTAVPSSVINTPNIQVEVGIIGTPVIDPASRTLYVVAKTYENGTQIFRLHALDLATGAEKAGSPVLITASVPGTGDGNDGAGHVPFLASQENQRVALTLAAGRVYLAFASHEDYDPYHGWVLAYDAGTLAQVAVYNTSPNGGRAGIWQGGAGPVVDGQNNLYFMTGNGTSDIQTGGTSVGETFIKLGPDLSLKDYFMPNDFDSLNAGDVDLGSSGPVAIPGTPYLAGIGKQGVLYLVNSANLGQYSAGADAVVQEFQACNGLWGPVAFYNNKLYVWGVGDSLRAYTFASGLFKTTPSTTSSVTTPWGGDPCGTVSVSANGTTSGTAIVWATACLADPDHATVGGVLYAFDANNLKNELWDSLQFAARDDYGNFAKFCPPTIANGKVYVPTDSGQVVVYGPRPYSAPPPPKNLTATPGSGSVRLTWVKPAGDVTGYRIDRTGPYSPLTTWFVTTTSFIDNTVSNGTTYQYTVAAGNTAGYGPKAAPVSATPGMIPGAILSLDFVGNAPGALSAASVAGVVPAAHWNSGSGASGSLSGLLDDRGGLTAASASWTSANTWSTGIGTSTPDMLMMDGYLDDGDGGNVTVSVSGLPATFTASGYDVYVYCDGDNGGSARTGGYTIGSTTVDALDPANTNFSGTYTQASNSAGNYVVLPNQTASSFTLTAAPVSSADGVMRAPVNAVQIVAHQPEFAVTIKSVSTGTPLGETMAALGARPYVDNGAMVTGIKNVLGGGILVRTAYKDRLVPAASSYLTLTLSAPGTVYVCYNNLQPLPAWLKDGTWTPTSNLVYLGSNIFQAYAKTVPAGDITLGGNLAASATAANFCYFVIAQPQ